ncbi:hypothetical protein [Aurantiacibacter sediminis]|uniref:Peptidase C-terminal archaeal/bacterial domain-containing protein n=1 Tax=Aurantiacibacter sediminis TaxID=2793064 RepID=A0ABS0N4F4_9SPHN|nr:hypothetical protein [Aurantiacibacter sediminis]MBH5322180.1 hypothetical protein [Aurantiacibacter sediminis]
MRFGFHKTALLIGAAAIMAPATAFAQARDLDSAQSDVRVFQGTVDSAEAVYEVSVPAGSVMQIDVMSTSDLDPIVTVTDTATGEQIAEDDDGGEGLNSRVRIRGEDTGRRISIAVNSFDASWVGDGETYGGSFDLRLETSEYVPVETRTVTYGARETGRIDGEPNLFEIAGVAGQMVEIALLAGDDQMLDPLLELRDASGEVIAYNDDGGNGLNSYIAHVFEESGTYTIAATGYSESTGDFILRVRDQREATAQLPLQVIGFADQASGDLASSFSDDPMRPSFIDYQLSESALAAIRSGDGDVTIRMNAVEGGDADFGGDIDPYLEVGFDTPLGFAIVATDDDGSGTLDSMLPLDLGLLADNPELLSMLRIRAKGLGGSSGAYTLEITEGMEARAEPIDFPAPVMIPPPAPPASAD